MSVAKGPSAIRVPARGAPARLRQAESGLASVELALLAPVLALIMVAVIDYGSAWSRQMALANAVRAGIQYAMIRRPIQGDVSQIHQSVIDAAPADLAGTPQVALVCTCPGGAPGSVDCDTGDCGAQDMETYLSVGLQEDFTMILDWPFIGNPISLGDQAVIRLN